MLQYKRVLLKLSGEALAGEDGYGINSQMLERYAEEVKEARAMGAEIALVIGGGNIFRGVSDAARNMDRVQADYMGMLATVINSIAFQDALERQGVYTRLQTAIKMEDMPSRSFGDGLSGIWKRGGLSFSVQEPVTPISLPIRRLHCGPLKLRLMSL